MPNDAVIGAIVLHHWEEAATAYVSRSLLADASHVRLGDLRRFDDRLAAHLDGLAVAGDDAWRYANDAFEADTPGSLFVAAVRAIDERSDSRFERLVSAAATHPSGARELVEALGWLDQYRLQGVVANLLKSENPVHRMLGIGACGVHRVDPGTATARWFVDEAAGVRARTAELAGELGHHDLAPACGSLMGDESAAVRFWAAWATLLLGNRGSALALLSEIGSTPGPYRWTALSLALQAMNVGTAHNMLQSLTANPDDLRWLLRGSGIGGDPTYVPWQIGRMVDDSIARVAGEAFSLITGLDLTLPDFERKRPDTFEPGPTEDPDDTNTALDQDEGLPWPDPESIRAWWSKNSNRFQPGTRYFMGQPVTREHCIDVLKNGYQRQRVLAAHYLCLLDPGTPLFNTSAPAWRQQKLLASMK